jgi:hypothetical protein
MASLKEERKYAPNHWEKNIKNDVGPINDNDVWRTRYNNELFTLYDELDSQSDKNEKNEVDGTPV